MQLIAQIVFWVMLVGFAAYAVFLWLAVMVKMKRVFRPTPAPVTFWRKCQIPDCGGYMIMESIIDHTNSRAKLYKCETCGARKTIIKPYPDTTSRSRV